MVLRALAGVVGGGLAWASVAVLGCASERSPAGGEPAAAAHALTDKDGVCPGASCRLPCDPYQDIANQSKPYQADATRIFRYISGGPNDELPARLRAPAPGSACVPYKTSIASMRDHVLRGEAQTEEHASTVNICYLPSHAANFRYTKPTTGIHPYPTLIDDLVACWGGDKIIIKFAATLGTNFMVGLGGTTDLFLLFFDPELAVLDAVSSAEAASAAAHGQNSGQPLTVHRFGAPNLSAAGRAAWLGRPCVEGTEPFVSGALVQSSVVFANSPRNTYLRCRAPSP